MKNVISASLLWLSILSTVNGQDQDPELKPFQGHWEVIELSEDGHVIPKEAIREWLPSGGKLEISGSAILATSPVDGKKMVRLFTIDATQYPRGIEMVTREKKEAIGIYQFDDGKLVVCLVEPESGQRPTDFTARQGSKRMLMVLKRVSAPEVAKAPAPVPTPPPATPGTGAAAKVLTDAEVSRLLLGTWRFKDDAGALLFILTADGNWSTVREVETMQLFQKVFVRTPISSGRWVVQNGVLTFHCLGSIHPERVNQKLPFQVRSVSDKDFIFVDYVGRLGKATRVP